MPKTIKDLFGNYQCIRGDARNVSLYEIKCCGNVVPLEIEKMKTHQKNKALHAVVYIVCYDKGIIHPKGYSQVNTGGRHTIPH